MKVGIIHFSDIHVKSSSDFIVQNKKAVAQACKATIVNCTKVLVIVTGDLAFSGKSDEYNVVYDFLKYIEDEIRSSTYVNTYEYILVPGNHDCDFNELDSVTRRVRDSIKGLDEESDMDVISCCLKPQNAFWNFYNKLQGVGDACPQVSYSKTSLLTSSQSIHFNCYNSSLLSEKDEASGTLIIPENFFIPIYTNKKKEDIVISLFHHNTSWLSPNTNNNNKKKFEQHIIQTSNIVMCGHEHSADKKLISDLSSNSEISYLEGAALQNGKESAFSVYIYDTESNSIHVIDLQYSDDYYTTISEKDIFIKRKNTGIVLNENFENSLNKIEIPIKHPIKQDLLLSDLFVWQDLETINDSKDHSIQYIDSLDVLTTSSHNIIFIEGESQSGKSSLLKMTYQMLLNKGVYPILVNGKDAIHPNISNLLKQCYKQQYQNDKYKYDKYLQLDKENKVVLIDDLNKSTLNYDGKSLLFDNLSKIFKQIIVVSTIQNDVKSYLLRNSNNLDIKRYRLSSLGYEKRNKLIEKWVRLGKDVYTCDEFAIEHEIKLTFDQVTNLLGERLVPSFPIFILSLLQSLNQAFKQFDVSQTSYAFCYKSLIIATLWRTGVPSERIDGVINFLKEFAYSLYCADKESFTNIDFRKFYTDYSQKFHTIYSSDKFMEIFCSSNIFKVEQNITFSYRYIFYYLIASKISILEDRALLDSIVNNLCTNIHEERSANILIFMIHNTGSKQFVDNLLYTSMLPFENSPMATLAIEDSLFKNLSDLVNEIKSEVLIENTNSKEERIKALKASDNIERQVESKNSNSTSEIDDPVIRDLNNTIRIIRILGQIVKNQSETFEKSLLIEIIEEAYKVGFRTIGFFTQMINDNKEDFVQFILEENNKVKRFDEHSLEDRVRKLLAMILYRICLSTFSNLSFAIGNPEMEEVYDEVANRIGSPAAKVVSFTIKSYYNKMKISDLKDIVQEFKGNPVVLEIIKARVIRYVYHNPIDVSTRQQIGAICNLKLVNNAHLNKHIQNDM